MENFRYADSANVDFIAALKTIQQYFEDKESPELGEKHIELFKAELKNQEQRPYQKPGTLSYPEGVRPITLWKEIPYFQHTLVYRILHICERRRYCDLVYSLFPFGLFQYHHALMTCV